MNPSIKKPMVVRWEYIPVRILFGLLLAGNIVACDGDSGSAETSTGDSDSESDIPIVSPYESIDCSDRGTSPETCEYIICADQQFYDRIADPCNEDMTSECLKEMYCYQISTDCMTAACPPNTAAPETTEGKIEAGIYDCKTVLEDCQAPTD